MRVLVTDGGEKHTLGAVRALGREGVHVVVGARSRLALAALSRYCASTVLYPSESKDEGAFVESVSRAVKDHRIDVLLPIGYGANVIFSRHRDQLRKITKLAVADPKAMAIASDKERTMAFARAAGIPTPRTYGSAAEVDAFPVVVKASIGTGGVTYVNSRSQLDGLDLTNAVLQDYIPGDGFGFYGLFNEGSLRAFFMHRRLREFPVTGGASTAAAAFYDERLKDLGVRLMGALKWHGVAMVEMKKDIRDGDYKLMEINAKFWGSLDLSIAAGVNFPFLACRMAMDGDIEPVLDYDRTMKFRWPFPNDLVHAVARPSAAARFLMDFFDPHMKTNLSVRDWLPSAYLVATTPYVLARRLAGGSLFRPHGTPRK